MKRIFERAAVSDETWGFLAGEHEAFAGVASLVRENAFASLRSLYRRPDPSLRKVRFRGNVRRAGAAPEDTGRTR